ncbi:rhodanese-like domain-containing protein [Seonamhaeicola aphaedonensis]|uniref:Rhodanese-related sulfurtransferase n=1 Tax=Seonamhaeicola aphaedonensis TaxID=1461338 RepID=A0A3D9HFU6_9FLAO|nr:rhodanese-like domain-containing protein [Seonamhaeicola aphaedonensis]RED48305.1 rhodanese-related sulfurtransferase [Seonamhaeicola aphaedonensis]
MKHFLIFGFLVFTTFIACNSTAQNKALISADKMKTMLLKDKTIQLIDVRTPKEFEEGHIKNANNIDFYSETFKEEITKLDPNKTLLLYCRSGGRSGKTSKILQELGFKKVYDLEGGILKWKEKGFKLVK